MKRAESVDHYIEMHTEWAAALRKLRKLINATDLEETVKWGAPIYTLDDKNVIGIGAFKEHVALWFHNGAFLEDADKVLINACEGKTRGLRQWRFSSARDVPAAKVTAYVKEAIANQRAGKAIVPDRNKKLAMPGELVAALANKPKAKKAFAALTKGRQREYADHIGGAKQEKTRVARAEKALPGIEAGVGLHDKYRNC